MDSDHTLMGGYYTSPQRESTERGSIIMKEFGKTAEEFLTERILTESRCIGNINKAGGCQAKSEELSEQWKVYLC